jgi:tetratricopeptide (TPR) repeat protein
LLTSLRSLLREAKPLRYNHRVALFGMGGAGKTELAMEYAHRYKTDYHFVFSLPAESRLALISGYVTIAQQTHCVPVPAKASPDGVAKSVLQWLQAQTTKSWLIILDNLDEITDAKGLLPIGNEHHHTIITTRDTNVFGIPAEGLPVAEMEEIDAIQLLLLECGPIVESEPDAAVYAKEIVQVLGSLPLAIHHAAAFIRGTGNIAAFCSTFRKSHKDMMNKRPHGNYPYENSVTAAFQLCFQDKRLREEAPSSVRLVEMLAFLNADVLLDFLESGTGGLSPELKAIIDDQFSFAEALRGLQVFSLIKTTKGGRQISMHRLVQHIVRDNLQTEGNYIARFDDCIALCTAAFPYLSNPDSPDFRVTRDGVPSWDSASRERFRLFVPQIMPCLECYEGEGSATFARLLEDLAYFLRDEGFYDVSIQLWERSLAVRSRLGGPVHLDTLASKYGLAVSLGRNGKMESASVLLEEVYEGRTKILGATHPDTLWSLHVLAWSYRVNRIHEAATLFEKALESQTATLGSKHTDTLRTKHALAVVYDRLGRTAEAAQLLQETFHTQLEVLGTDNPDTVRSKNGLAFAFGHLRRFDEAAVLFEELMEERIKRLGSEHIDTLWTKHGLACAYAGLGRMKEAKLLLEEILVLQSRTLGADHPMTLSTKHCLSAVFRNLGLDTEGNEEDARSMAAVKSAGSFLVT